jgi:hypothetical protein
MMVKKSKKSGIKTPVVAVENDSSDELDELTAKLEIDDSEDTLAENDNVESPAASDKIADAETESIFNDLDKTIESESVVFTRPNSVRVTMIKDLRPAPVIGPHNLRDEYAPRGMVSGETYTIHRNAASTLVDSGYAVLVG